MTSQSVHTPDTAFHSDAAGEDERDLFVPSFAQEGLWLLDQLETGSAFYNVLILPRLKGQLDVTALQRSLQAIIQRHETLRTTLVTVDERPMQAIALSLPHALPLLDLSDLAVSEREAALQTLSLQAVATPFDLAHGPLLASYLIRLANEEHILLVTLHHAIADGWSTEIFTRELGNCYAAFASGEEPSLPELPIQYADYAVWQREVLQGEGRAELDRYWREQLADAPALLALPTDYPRPAVQSHRGARHFLTLPASLFQELRAFSRREGVTLFMTLLTAFQVLLMRYSGQEDIVVGTPLAGRTRRELEGLIGLFANTLVLRSKLPGSISLRESLARVREVCLEAYSHQEMPFELLVELLQPERSLSYSPIYQVLFGLQNFSSTPLKLAGLEITPVEMTRQTSRFDIVCDLLETADELVCRVEYNSDLFRPETIARLVAHYQRLLQAFVTNADCTLARLPLLSESEQRELLYERNQTQRDYPAACCLHELLERQALRTPDAIALMYEDEQMTYGALYARAEQVACALQALGIGPERLVGLYLDRSVHMVVALLAVLKAGGAYVPLDPDYPSERLAFIVRDARIAVLLTQQHLLASLPAADCQTLCLDASLSPLPADQLSSCTLQPENLAYVLYTSGSTGTPKGVQVCHRSVVNFLTSMQQEPGLCQGDTLLAVTSLSFDIAGLELFLPLLVGARLEVASREIAMDGVALAARLKTAGATVLQATPASWQMLLQAGWSNNGQLKVLCGGEALPRALAQELLAGGLPIWNLYGPTETTIWSTLQKVQEIRAGEGSVPIGYPIANTRVYVLDAHLQLVPPGVPGELYIGGTGLARGYFSRPDLTAERFVPHPWPAQPGERLYRTGDRVRLLPNGSLHYLDRLDSQVKLRGYRIELGEIEAALNHLPAVARAAVLIREDTPDEKRLVAYVVPKDDALAATPGELRSALQGQLPEYMVPASFVLLDALPLTPNGKINRRMLPAPDTSLEYEAQYVAPRSTTEEIVAQVWSKLLRVKRVGIHDNFFALGGHSLLGVQLMMRLREAVRVGLPLRTLFVAPTIAQLAALIVEQQGKQEDSQALPVALPTVVPDPEHRFLPFPLTDVQQAYWIGRNATFEMGNIATHTYTEWESNSLDLERFIEAWRRLIARHEMLRAIVTPDGKQHILPEVPPYTLPMLDLRGQPREAVEAQLQTVRTQLSHQVFSPERWPLFELRASLLDGGRTRLHISSDALMIDAWSWRIITRELDQFYLDPNYAPPPLTLSFRDYVLTEHTLHESALYQRARDYWWKRLPELPPAPDLPLAQNPASLKQPYFKRRARLLEPATWGALKQRAAQRGLTPSSVLLTAFAVVLGMWSKSQRFTINLTLFNRLPLHPQVQEIVGDFTSLTLLALDHTKPATFQERAQQVQQQLWEDLEHRYVSGVAVLRELARVHASPARATMPVVFTSALGLQDDTPSVQQEVAWREERVYSISQTSQVWLDHQVREQGNALLYSWDTVEDLFPDGLLDAMFVAYNQMLDRLAGDDLWDLVDTVSLLPPRQLEQRQAMNATDRPASSEMLHTLFAAQAAQRPEQQAVVTSQKILTYQELAARARQLGQLLRQRKVEPGQLVAIVMEKGWEQVVATLGVLYAGGAYLPIDPELPEERLRYLMKHGEVRVALTQSRLNRQLPWPKDINRISVDQLRPGDLSRIVPEASFQQPEDLAYVIYTSGSTGLPKGVMIDHRGAVNTILAVNETYGVGSQDRVLALSSLSFDLSVYDIFGTLAAGGTIVLPDHEARRDPAHWTQLLEQEQVTIWNSVPALMELEAEYLLRHEQKAPVPSLRLILLSGDWIPLSLPEKLWSLWKQAQTISLGGATEASIWSIWYPIEQIEVDWKSIPYGHPMPNQHFYVLNAALEPCPTWVPGELYIGGSGLARGYWRDCERTEGSFFQHPRSGERLYRTGDLGRYLPSGEIEFLGREDFQVKLRGYRIELGEIEAVLSQQPGVGQAVVIVHEGTRDDRRLVAYIVPATPGLHPTAAALQKAAQQRLPEYMVPAAFIVLEQLPLTPNGKLDRRALPAPDWTAGKAQARTAEALPQMPSSSSPTSSVEQAMSALWQEVLGLEQVALEDNFFELGGHSLLAVQLLTRIYETLHINLPLRAVFEAPTVAGLARACADAQAAATTSAPSQAAPELIARAPNAQASHQHNGQQLAKEASSAGKAEQGRARSNIMPGGDSDERERLKTGLGAVRKDQAGSWSIHLAEPVIDSTLLARYRERNSARAFGAGTVSLADFSQLLHTLRHIMVDGKLKRRWGSAGGLYPVQVYLSLKQDRVENLPAGTYYYHPVEHRLASLTLNGSIGPEVHTWINQRLFEQSAFSLYLIGQLDAIVPLYGDFSRDYCLLEAGMITQLLETAAGSSQIGLCQTGGLHFEQIRSLFKLDDGHIYLHSLLGGPRATGETAPAVDQDEDWEEGQL